MCFNFLHDMNVACEIFVRRGAMKAVIPEFKNACFSIVSNFGIFASFKQVFAKAFRSIVCTFLKSKFLNQPILFLSEN